MKRTIQKQTIDVTLRVGPFHRKIGAKKHCAALHGAFKSKSVPNF